MVYIPGCRDLLHDLFGYLQFALVLAYHGLSDTEEAWEYLEQCQTIEHLTTFYVQASSDHRLQLLLTRSTRWSQKMRQLTASH